MMGGRGGTARTETASPGAVRDEGRVTDLLRQLGPISEDWISLARLRDNLGGMSRERQNAAIERLLLEGRIGLLPEKEPRMVRARERAAAFRHHGINYHLIRLRRS